MAASLKLEIYTKVHNTLDVMSVRINGDTGFHKEILSPIMGEYMGITDKKATQVINSVCSTGDRFYIETNTNRLTLDRIDNSL